MPSSIAVTKPNARAVAANFKVAAETIVFSQDFIGQRSNRR
jgi:hypothetical protein